MAHSQKVSNNKALTTRHSGKPNAIFINISLAFSKLRTITKLLTLKQPISKISILAIFSMDVKNPMPATKLPSVLHDRYGLALKVGASRINAQMTKGK